MCQVAGRQVKHLLKVCSVKCRYKRRFLLLAADIFGATGAVVQAAAGATLQHFSTAAAEAHAQALSAPELHRAAKLARLSGLCYLRADELSARLQLEGLQLVCSGMTHFTRCVMAACTMKYVRTLHRRIT